MTHLKVGDPAPNFSVMNEKGDSVSLKTYAGKRLILYFYPKDLTPGCSVEACNLRDHYSDLIAHGFEVLGVSMDNEKLHKRFIEKHSLPFHLLCDVDKKVIDAYGVWGPKKFMGREFDGIHRTTFVINGEGIIEAVIEKVVTKTHTEQILEELKNN
jgi:peroxiredoxin Q/BCP